MNTVGVRRVRGAAGRVVLCLWLAGSVSRAERSFVSYPLGSMDPAGAAEVVRTALGEGDRALTDPALGRLLVWAPPSVHEKVAGLLRALDPPARNVRIEVVFEERGAGRRAGAGLEGEGRVTLPAGGRPEVGAQARLRAHRREDRTEARTVQTLLVASGREARLRVGERIPQPEWFLDYGRRHGLLVPGPVAWREEGAFLSVSPLVLGEGPEIRVRLVPELSGRTDAGDPFRLRFVSAATEVTVRSGETVSLGGWTEDREFYSRFLLGSGASGSSRSLEIRLTPTLAPP